MSEAEVKQVNTVRIPCVYYEYVLLSKWFTQVHLDFMRVRCARMVEVVYDCAKEKREQLQLGQPLRHPRDGYKVMA